VSRLEDLPPDLHAVLSLVVCRQKSYDEVAGMVGIEEHAVHDRAHAALAMLAPSQARELSVAQRERVGEYVLGQDDPAGRRETRAHLGSEAPARAWAQALVAELAPLASRPLPEIPAGAAAPAATQPEPSATPPAVGPKMQPPPTATPSTEPPPANLTAEREPSAAEDAPEAPRSSRRGGMIVLGATAAVVLAAVVLIVSLGGGSGSNPSSTDAASSTPASTSTSTASTTPTTGSASTTSSTPAAGSTSTSTTGSTASKKAAGEPRIDATIPLTSPNPSAKALGIVEVISRGNVRAFLVVAEHLPPTTGFRYAAWLYNSPTDALLLGSGPKVGSNGILKAAGGLPANAGHYGTIVLTEEHSEKPAQPGPIVLSGTFKVG
jgi:hypothetical protein